MINTQWLHNLSPSCLLTRGAGWLAKVKIGFIKNLLISRFIRYYDVDMSTAVRQSPEQFQNFQDFFTRELKPAARLIDSTPNGVVSPVDGTIASWGRYTNNTLIQYKSTSTNVFNLTRSRELADSGYYGIVYLSPKDYHRVHAPVNCELKSSSRIGGTRHSVKPANHENIDGLYERNVRLNCFLETQSGTLLFSMVGAMIVSSIETDWEATQQAIHNHPGVQTTGIQFTKGDELGRFCLGSTVILVIPDGVGQLDEFEIGQSLKLGEKIGTIQS